MRLDAKHSFTRLSNPTCSVPSFVLVMNMTSGSGQSKEEEEAPQDSSIEKACVQRDDIIKHDRNLWNDPTYMPHKRLRWKARKAFAEEKARKARVLNRLQTTVGKMHAACSAESFEVARSDVRKGGGTGQSPSSAQCGTEPGRLSHKGFRIRCFCREKL